MSALLAYHQGNLTVPDSHHASTIDYPVDRFSLYEYETFPSSFPAAEGVFGKEPGTTDSFDQFLQDSTLDFLPGLNKPWAQPSPSSSSPLTLNPPFLPPSPPSHALPPQPDELIDLGLFCEPGFTTDEGSTFSTLPPSPVSAPLSPEEQEIQDIVSSFQDTSSPFSTSCLALSPAASSPLYVQLTQPSNDPSDPSIPTVPQFVPTKPKLSSSSLDECCQKQSDDEEYQHNQQNPNCPKRRRRKMPQTKRKERKKEQNKMAALRYRQKKKEEGRVVDERQEELETVNRNLKKQLNSLETEINYLKQLWTEVHLAQQQNRLN